MRAAQCVRCFTFLLLIDFLVISAWGRIDVTSTADTGPGSLRQAIADALPNETIRMRASSRQVELTSGPITITKPVHVRGGGQYSIGAKGHRAFVIDLEETARANIVFVSLHETDAPSAEAAAGGLTEAPDKGYTDLLRREGFNVTRWLSRDDPTTADAALLNAADLIIISRSIDSGHFKDDEKEVAFWNEMITTPIINMAGYTLRSNRLAWTAGTAMQDLSIPSMRALDENHPILESRSFLYRQQFPGERGISISLDDPVGGTVITKMGQPIPFEDRLKGIITYPAGATVANGNVLGGPRLFFPSGGREASGADRSTAGQYDLTPDSSRGNTIGGETLFLQAVSFFAPHHPRVTIRDTEFIGGGMENRNAILRLSNLMMSDCESTFGGAISNAGDLEVALSVIYQCEATEGGAVYNTGDMAVENSTFSLNKATLGGAIYNTGDLDLHHVTIGGNNATENGGGLAYAGQDDTATLRLRNTIVADNTTTSGAGSPDIHVVSGSAGQLLTEGVSLLSNASGSTLSPNANLLVANPRLLRLLPFAGRFIADADTTMVLQVGSPAIDAAGPTDLPHDQLWRSRVANGVPDIGAYESGIHHQVTNTNDSGPGSFRGTILALNLGDGLPSNADNPPVVTFAPELAGQTIALESPIDLDVFGVNVPTIAIDGSSLTSKVTIQGSPNGPELARTTLILDNGVSVYSVDFTGEGADTGIFTEAPLFLHDVSVSGYSRVGVESCCYADIVLSETTLSQNSRGLFIGGGSAILDHASVIDNTGLGIDIREDTDVTMAHCLISRNGGRGIEAAGSSINLRNSNISHNSGGIHCDTNPELEVGSFLSLDLENVTISNNITTGNGGGILFLRGGEIMLNNVTLANNAANLGGGIYYSGNSVATLNHVTVTGNHASSQGGGLWNEEEVVLSNSIIAGNTSAEGPDLYENTASSDAMLGLLGANLLSDLAESTLSAGSDLIVSATPGLASLGVYGGDTQTVALLPGSPAIDAATVTALLTDQRGLPREAGAAPDIGSYESGNGGYGDWVTAALPSGLVTSYNADADSDGSGNGSEYALGTNLAIADSGSDRLLSGTVAGDSGDSTIITFGYNPAAATDTAWVVRRSRDLIQYEEIYRFEGPSGVETKASGITAVRTNERITIADQTVVGERVFYQFIAELR